MSTRKAMNDGATSIAQAVRRIDAGIDRASPTPCADFDLASLVNHVLGTTRAMARLAGKGSLDPDHPWGGEADEAHGNWPDRLATQIETTAEACNHPEAWHGSLDVGGGPQPAETIGEMAFIEIMMHGWDVARAGGQRPEVSDFVGAELLRAVSNTADLGRRMGAYGPQIETAATASSFDKALAVAGRDPGWIPADRAAAD